jgi:hypothetical protein
VVFGLFHADVWRVPSTALLGTILAVVCWRSGSILPAMLIHFANNAAALFAARWGPMQSYLGFNVGHPPGVLALAAAAVIAGLWVMSPRRAGLGAA